MSLSLRTVLVTVTLSLLPDVDLPLLPLNRATNNKINTAAPIIHTHGEVYHSVVCSVVIVVEEELELDDESCARTTSCIKLKTNRLIKDLNVISLIECFIFFIFC